MRKQFMNALLPSVANDNVIGLAVWFDEQLQHNTVIFLQLGILSACQLS